MQVSQQGDLNLVDLLVTGSGNELDIQQSGNGNWVASSDGAAAVTGNDGTISVNQQGNDNLVNVQQGGEGSVVTVVQNGDFNVATINQR